MSDLVRSCCANVALTTAIAMAATAVYPAAQTPALQADGAAYSVVNMPVLNLASLESSLAAADPAPSQPTVTSPREATQSVIPTAAEATPGDALYDFVREVVFWASVAVLPLWWVAFPVTFPLGWILADVIYPPSPIYNPLQPRGLTNILYAVAAPPFLAVQFFPSRELATASAATPSASAARSLATSTDSLSDTATASTDETATQLKGDSARTKPAAPRSNRPAKSAAAVVSTEASDKRDDDPAVSKGNAASSRSAGGRSRVKEQTPQSP